MLIYKIQNKINGKIYIGITKRKLNQRISDHLVGNKSLISKALKKYGKQSFNIIIIDTADDWFTLCDKEKEYIKFFNSKAPNGYNLTDGGEGVNGYIFTKEECIRRSIFHTGLKQSPETIAKRIKSNAGFKHKRETIEKIRKIKTGLKYSAEINKKKSCPGEKNGFYNKHHTEETKEINRQKHLGKKRPDVSKSNRTRQTHPMTEETKIKIKNKKEKNKKIRQEAGIIRIAWNRGLKMKNYRSEYINPLKGKKRPDVSERNKLNIKFNIPIEILKNITKNKSMKS